MPNADAPALRSSWRLLEVVVGTAESEDREIVGSLENPPDGQFRLARVMQRGRGGAAGEALDMLFRRGSKMCRFCEDMRHSLRTSNRPTKQSLGSPFQAKFRLPDDPTGTGRAPFVRARFAAELSPVARERSVPWRP